MLLATSADANPRRKAPVKACVIAVANPGNKLAIDGIELPDFAPATLEKALGKPDRVEQRTSKQRYEEWGHGGMPPTSTLVEVTDLYYVYDARGLVFPTRRKGKFDQRPNADRMIVFFANKRTFDHVAAPAVTPKQRGACRLEINGVAVDPTKDLRPRGLTYRTDKVGMFGIEVAPTSSATVIDSLYADDGSRHFQIYLDAPKTGRPSYAEIR